MVCPSSPDTHRQFSTTAIEAREWQVDGDGEFLADLGCTGVVTKPDTSNRWTCCACGADAISPAALPTRSAPGAAHAVPTGGR